MPRSIVSKNTVTEEIKALLGSWLRREPSSIRNSHELKDGLTMIGKEVTALDKPCTRIAKALGEAAGTNPVRVTWQDARDFVTVQDVINTTHKRANGDST